MSGLFVTAVVALSIGLIVGIAIIASNSKEHLYANHKTYLAVCVVSVILHICGLLISSGAPILSAIIAFVAFLVGGASTVPYLYVVLTQSEETAIVPVATPEPQVNEPRKEYDIASINKRINELRRDANEDRS